MLPSWKHLQRIENAILADSIDHVFQFLVLVLFVYIEVEGEGMVRERRIHSRKGLIPPDDREICPIRM